MTTTVVSFDMHLVSLANQREGWRKSSRRAKEQRAKALVFAAHELHHHPVQLPVRVHITRHGPRKLDSDNLAISAKHVRDGVADALGCDDGDEEMVTWSYSQERSKKYRVVISIEERNSDAEA